MSSKSILALSDELLHVVFKLGRSASSDKYAGYEEQKQANRDLYSWAQTCRRFRVLLLPSIYTTVSFARSPLNRPHRLQTFLELAERYGHFCQDLTIKIGGDHFLKDDFIPSLTALLTALPRYKKLKLLCLDLTVPSGGKEREDVDYKTGLTSKPQPTTMDATQKAIWEKICTSLPSTLSELQLYGFTWQDAAAGLGLVRLRSVKTLYLSLSAPSPITDHSSRVFSTTFSGLKHLTFPEWWCFTMPWSMDAFDKLRLESITTFKSPAISHPCTSRSIPGCEWVWGMKWLLNSQTQTLKTFKTSSPLFLDLASQMCGGGSGIRFEVGTVLPKLTSLVLTDLDFDDDLHTLHTTLRPFFHSKSLKTLIMDDCRDVPQDFCKMLEKGYHGGSGYLWPKLKTLSIDQWMTCSGPGDEDIYGEMDWDEMDGGSEGPDFPHWRPESRKKLESLAAKRKISLEGEWEWWEGYG